MNEQILDHGDNNTVNQQKRSGMATASLICSLILCCPIVTLVGVILGIVALLRIRSSNLSGKGLAWGGIIIGVVATTLSSLFIAFAVNMAFDILEQTQTSVTGALESGIQGDIAGFREEFSAGAISGSDEEIKIFVDTLTSRYGNFDKAVIDMEAMQDGQQSSGDQAEMPMQLVFETKTVSSTVLILFVPGGDSFLDIQIQCLLIHDPENGELAFPIASQCGSAIPPVNPTDEN
jgi:hypothetical protein